MSSPDSTRIVEMLARLREPDAVAILVRARQRRGGRPWMDRAATQGQVSAPLEQDRPGQKDKEGIYGANTGAAAG